jgi:hypothetical protein
VARSFRRCDGHRRYSRCRIGFKHETAQASAVMISIAIARPIKKTKKKIKQKIL